MLFSWVDETYPIVARPDKVLFSCVEEMYPRVANPVKEETNSVVFPIDVLNALESTARTVLTNWVEETNPMVPSPMRVLLSCVEDT